MQDEKKRIQKLTERLNYYADKYYNADNPEISDYEYDMMLRELSELEERYPEYALENSPTKKVGGVRSRLFAPVEHDVKMESLQDAFSLKNYMLLNRGSRTLWAIRYIFLLSRKSTDCRYHWNMTADVL